MTLHEVDQIGASYSHTCAGPIANQGCLRCTLRRAASRAAAKRPSQSYSAKASTVLTYIVHRFTDSAYYRF